MAIFNSYVKLPEGNGNNGDDGYIYNYILMINGDDIPIIYIVGISLC
jgi:hypothetical protein